MEDQTFREMTGQALYLKRSLNYPVQIYIGTFRNGKREGYGEEFYANAYFMGEWANDRITGNGTFVGDQGPVEGNWRNNKLAGPGMETIDLGLERNLPGQIYCQQCCL